MHLHIYPEDQMAAEAAALLIAAQILVKPNSVLGLATGSTPLPVYRRLVEMNRQGLIDFSGVVSYNLDEYRGLAPDHPCAYRRFMQDHLFSKINIGPENTFVPSGIARDVEAECQAYDAAIRRSGGIDLQLLGIGANGHIGFNEPGDVFTTGCYCAALSAQTISDNRRFFPQDAPMPTHAVTMGIGTIMQARSIVLVATGANKAEAVRDMMRGPVQPRLPASILQMHRNVTVLADAQAAQLL